MGRPKNLPLFFLLQKKVQKKNIFSFSSFEVHLQRAPSLLKKARFSGRGLTSLPHLKQSAGGWKISCPFVRKNRRKKRIHQSARKSAFSIMHFSSTTLNRPPLFCRKFAATKDLPQREPHYGFRKINAHHPTPPPHKKERINEESFTRFSTLFNGLKKVRLRNAPPPIGNPGKPH